MGETGLKRLERLSEFPHLTYSWYVKVAQQTSKSMAGRNQDHAFDSLEREKENFRAALDFSRAIGDDESYLQICNSISQFWNVRGYWQEGRERLLRAMDLEPKPETEALRARALLKAGIIAYHHGDNTAALFVTEESARLHCELDDLERYSANLNNLGLFAHDAGDYSAARAFYEESLEVRRKLGSSAHISATLNTLGLVSLELGEFDRADELLNKALQLNRDLNDVLSEARSLAYLGFIW